MSAKPKPGKIAPVNYPEYILNFISSDQVSGIPTSTEKPTGTPGTPEARATELAIEKAARVVVEQKQAHVLRVHGSHTLSVSAAGQFVDVFVSHHNEDKDALPTINVVFRAR